MDSSANRMTAFGLTRTAKAAASGALAPPIGSPRLLSVISALLPVFAVIALGWATRASGVVPKDQWAGINKLAYWVFFPALLFSTIGQADLSSVAAGPFVGAAIVGFSIMGLLTAALRWPLRDLDGAAFSSVFQGGVRWNGIVLLAAAPAVYGEVGVALAALVFLPVVPLVNVMSVGALSVWGTGERPNAVRFTARLATNPLILGCLAGAAANITGLFSVEPLARTADILAAAALAGGLLGVGAGLDTSSLTQTKSALGIAVFLKLMLMPAVLWGCAALFGLDPLATAVLVGAGATPGAAASYVLARELGGDAPLTAGHVTATVALSAITMPLWIGAALSFVP